MDVERYDDDSLLFIDEDGPHVLARVERTSVFLAERVPPDPRWLPAPMPLIGTTIARLPHPPATVARRSRGFATRARSAMKTGLLRVVWAWYSA